MRSVLSSCLALAKPPLEREMICLRSRWPPPSQLLPHFQQSCQALQRFGSLPMVPSLHSNHPITVSQPLPSCARRANPPRSHARPMPYHCVRLRPVLHPLLDHLLISPALQSHPHGPPARSHFSIDTAILSFPCGTPPLSEFVRLYRTTPSSAHCPRAAQNFLLPVKQ